MAVFLDVRLGVRIGIRLSARNWTIVIRCRHVNFQAFKTAKSHYLTEGRSHSAVLRVRPPGVPSANPYQTPTKHCTPELVGRRHLNEAGKFQ